MNSRAKTASQAMKSHHQNQKEKEKSEMQGNKLMGTKKYPNRCRSRRERKIALQQDVDKLKKKLRHEENVHRALERAFTRPLGALPRLPPYLPPHTLELLAEVAVLEEEVVRLEEIVVNFRQELYKEAVYISSSKKNLENSGDLYQVSNWEDLDEKQCVSNRLSSLNKEHHEHYGSLGGKRLLKKNNSSMSFREDVRGKVNKMNANSTENNERSAQKVIRTKTSTMTNLNSPNSLMECNTSDEDNGPNKVSEDILKCLVTIFMKGTDIEAFPSVLGSGDPYGISVDFGRRDVGPYKQLCVIEEVSVYPDHLASSSFLMRRLKYMVDLI